MVPGSCLAKRYLASGLGSTRSRGCTDRWNRGFLGRKLKYTDTYAAAAMYGSAWQVRTHVLTYVQYIHASFECDSQSIWLRNNSFGIDVFRAASSKGMTRCGMERGAVLSTSPPIPASYPLPNTLK